MPQYIRNDISAYELCDDIPKGIHRRDKKVSLEELMQRIELEKSRKEIHVDYYRIGYTMGFSLPVIIGTEELPESEDAYVWKIWLTWQLKERWTVLGLAWRRFNDTTAGMLLQQELAALADWDHFLEAFVRVHLCTGHIAASLAEHLRDKTGWQDSLYEKAFRAAQLLMDRDACPWYEEHWMGVEKMTVRHMHNIPCIVLLGCADLAEVIGHPRAAEFDRKARSMASAWGKYTVGEAHYSEGTTYDGYFLDSLTEWMEHQHDHYQLVAEYEQSFAIVFQRWLRHTLPGRLDLHIPIGDVEAEMTFWMIVCMRFGRWYQWGEGVWLLNRFPAVRLPSIVLAGDIWCGTLTLAESSPKADIVADEVALTMRTGWDSDDYLLAISTGSLELGHFHSDCGQIVIGHRNRFWITDPGYQQYEIGLEREFTLGIQSHNIPIISGKGQTKRAPQLLQKYKRDNLLHASIDLTNCYRDVPAESVQRNVWMLGKENKVFVVRDMITSLPDGLLLDYYWQGGAYLAWSFKEGWARLSDGEKVLWVGTAGEKLGHSNLTRHEGTKGPLTLHHQRKIDKGSNDAWWFFCFDSAGHWQPPIIRRSEDAIELVLSGGEICTIGRDN